jgi:hypothetical protein
MDKCVICAKEIRDLNYDSIEALITDIDARDFSGVYEINIQNKEIKPMHKKCFERIFR